MLKKTFCSILVFSALAVTNAYARPASGTVVPVVVSSISEAGANALVSADVRDASGNVVISQGTQVQTQVNYQPARRLGRPAEATVKLVSVATRNGNTVPLTGEISLSGKSKKGKAAGLTAGMFFIYGPLNFLHLLHRGGDLPSGQAVHSFGTVQ